MASKDKAARENQNAYWEGKLKERIDTLAGQGLSEQLIAKDTAVRGIRARMRETGARLRAVARREEKVEEMARAKAEKLAAPKQEKGKKKAMAEEAPQASKRQQKKQKKKAAKE